MRFRLVPKSVTLNDLERRNGPYFAPFHGMSFLFVYEIVENRRTHLHGRRVMSLIRTSLKVKTKGQGHQGYKNGIFRPFRRPACGLYLVKHL